jgi:hypothetical protein
MFLLFLSVIYFLYFFNTIFHFYFGFKNDFATCLQKCVQFLLLSYSISNYDILVSHHAIFIIISEWGIYIRVDLLQRD